MRYIVKLGRAKHKDTMSGHITKYWTYDRVYMKRIKRFDCEQDAACDCKARNVEKMSPEQRRECFYIIRGAA